MEFSQGSKLRHTELRQTEKLNGDSSIDQPENASSVLSH